MLAVLVVGLGAALALTVVVIGQRLDNQAAELQRRRFEREASAIGLSVQGDQATLRAKGSFDGVEVAIDIYVERTRDKNFRRLAVGRGSFLPEGAVHHRMSARPEGHGDVQIFRENPPLHELVAYREVSIDPSFDANFRVFTRNGERPPWLTEEIRREMERLPKLHDLRVEADNLVLRVEGFFNEIEPFHRIAALVTLICTQPKGSAWARRSLAPEVDAKRFVLKGSGAGCGWSVAGFIGGFIGGAMLPMIVPGLDRMMTPLVCEPGSVAVGDWSAGLSCVNEATGGYSLTSDLGSMALVPWVMTLFFLLAARAYWKRLEEERRLAGAG